MRARMPIWIAGLLCLSGLGLYLSPPLRERVAQMLPQGVQRMLVSQPPADAAPGGSTTAGKAAGGKNARGATSVSAATATVADFPVLRYAIGFLSSPAAVNINARVASQVAAIAVKDGQMVRQGDLLISLADRALPAQVDKDKAMLARDQALADSAAADLERARILMTKQAGTQQAYDQALAAQKAAVATVAGDKASLEADQVQLSYATITAPISGRLGAVAVSVGDLVTAGGAGGATATSLVTITQMDPLQVNFNLPEVDLPLLQQALARPGASSVTLNRDGEDRPVGTGTLDFVNSTVDTASGTITARATVPNADMKLWPGQYVKITLDAGSMPKMVSVPTVAVQPSQNGPFVFVVKPDNTVEMRPVDVALTHGNDSAIAGGLRGGEKVVVDGQLNLRQGAAVRVAGSAESGDGTGKPASGGTARPAGKVASDATTD